jgi:hypothetical protein
VDLVIPTLRHVHTAVATGTPQARRTARTHV